VVSSIGPWLIIGFSSGLQLFTISTGWGTYLLAYSENVHGIFAWLRPRGLCGHLCRLHSTQQQLSDNSHQLSEMKELYYPWHKFSKLLAEQSFSPRPFYLLFFQKISQVLNFRISYLISGNSGNRSKQTVSRLSVSDKQNTNEEMAAYNFSCLTRKYRSDKCSVWSWWKH